MIKITNISKNTISKFLILWAILGGVYYIALAVATDALPPRIQGLSNIVLPFSILFALFVAAIATSRSKEDETVNNVFQNNIQIGVYGAVVVILLYIASVIFYPSNVVTSDELADALNKAELTVEQKNQVLKLLQQQDYVTNKELQDVGLNDIQIEQVIKIVKSETPSITPAPEPIPNSACYIQPQKKYATVSIRKAPDASYENAVGYLARGENIKVIGVALVGNDYWWKVDINHGIGSVEGWVIAWTVDINNPDACNQVERITWP
jgi:hypothetical protein